MNCVHYCSVGGHTWEHTCNRDKNGISDCKHKMNDPGYSKPVVKFFIVCDAHADAPTKAPAKRTR